MRADARRNRARVLAAAERVFAEHGQNASTEQIARDAGVGIGTLFRHFPTKEALLHAVFLGRLERLTLEAEALTVADDPGSAFFAFFNRVVDQAPLKNALAATLATTGVDVEDELDRARKALRRPVAKLLTRAQRVGAVRSDIGVRELMPLFVAASQAIEHAHGDRALQGRCLAVIVDGLRPSTARG